MQFETDSIPKKIDSSEISHLMRDVLFALVPGILVMIWFFGWGVITNLVVATVFALALEAIMLLIRGRPVAPFISDYSAVITAWLLALAIPAFAPWWLLLIGIFFAIVIAKQLYGGLGYNPFNPAMVGFAVLLISFPIEMVNWFTPIQNSMAQIGLMESLQIVFSAGNVSTEAWDAMTMATPLDSIKIGLTMDKSVLDIMQDNRQNTFGLFAGTGWEWVSLAYLAGGLWLMVRKVISWHIPFTLLIALTVFSGIFWFYDATTYNSPLFHLLAGGTMLGAFFIATDPISASTTPRGKIVYAIGIAFFIYVIRVWGSSYPDGIAFSVLVMNMAVPLIDYYTKPRVFGATK